MTGGQKIPRVSEEDCAGDWAAGTRILQHAVRAVFLTNVYVLPGDEEDGDGDILVFKMADGSPVRISVQDADDRAFLERELQVRLPWSEDVWHDKFAEFLVTKLVHVREEELPGLLAGNARIVSAESPVRTTVSVVADDVRFNLVWYVQNVLGVVHECSRVDWWGRMLIRGPLGFAIAQHVRRAAVNASADSTEGDTR